MRKRTDGFTLVELMVVVLVIGIIVAVAVPVFKTAQAQAAKNACQATQRTIRGAIEAWRAVNPDVPDVPSANYNYHLPPQGGTASPWVARLMPGYLKSVGLCKGPKTDAGSGRTWNAPYSYQVTADGRVVSCLWSMNPDGATGARMEHALP